MRYLKKTNILSVAHHRNGVGGIPFDVAIVDDGESNKVVVLFPERYACAVLDIKKLCEGNIKFSENSWRGDIYDDAFRKKIAAARRYNHAPLPLP